MLGPAEMARRLPGLAVAPSPRFCAARVAVTDLDATKRVLKANGVGFEVSRRRAAGSACGVAWSGAGIRRTGDNLKWLKSSVIIPQASTPLPAATAWGSNSPQHRRLLFVSGQVPEESDGSVPEGFEAQCEQAWRNVIAVLAAAGLGVEHLVKINTFLTDRSQVVANRAIRRKMLEGNEPASTVMIAETVDGKWLLEIEAIAAE